MCSVISSFSSAQTQRAILHSRRECRHESLAPPMEHALLSDMFLWRRTSFDGREHLASLHKNTCTLEGTLIPHNIDHSFCTACLPEAPTDPTRDLRCASILYAEWIEKRPRFSKCQAQKSCCRLALSGILVITATSVGVKNSISFSGSQDTDVESIEFTDQLRRVSPIARNRPPQSRRR